MAVNIKLETSVPEYFMNDIDVTSYKKHPRILELRFAFLYARLCNDFGVPTGLVTIEALCTAFQCDFNKIRPIINKVNEIFSVWPKSTARNGQEILFMGFLHDESPMVCADRYMHNARNKIYGKEFYKLKNFICEEWLAKLDDEVLVCGISSYRLELERFLDHWKRLSQVI